MDSLGSLYSYKISMDYSDDEIADYYLIPLKYEAGRYRADTLPKKGRKLAIVRTVFNTLECYHPRYDRELYVHEVPGDVVLYADYDENGDLAQIDFTENGMQRLLFIKQDATDAFKAYAQRAADEISKEILRQNQAPASRLFFDWFYDGAAVDFAAMLGTPADMKRIRERYHDPETDAVDCSGDYPRERRITYDLDTFRVMLDCQSVRQQSAVFDRTIREMVALIWKAVEPHLKKTPDFKVFADSYD